MPYVLTALTGPHKGRLWTIAESCLLLGRDASCDIVLTDTVVSRHQCRVALREGQVALEDAGSRNPTLVNGVPVKHAVLQAGDTLVLGHNAFLIAGTQATPSPSAPSSPLEATAAWDKDSPVLLRIEEARQQVDLRPNSLADLVFLYDLTRELGSQPTREAFLEALEQQVRERFRPLRYGVAFPQGDNDFFFYEEPEEDSGAKGQAMHAVVRECLREGPGILRPGMVEQEGRRQRLFTMAAPLVAGDLCLGAVAVQTCTPRGVYDEEDLKLLVLLAGAAAPALYTLEHRDLLAQENARLRAITGESDRLVGASRVMGQVRAQLRRAAKTNLNVLITGETGTGKELAARMVHAQSAQRNKPFVVVNCAAIPRDLFESELFGYVKGAFTGAIQNTPGLLSQAHTGILFLDEIGDLSLENQARILRAVEQGTFRPVGGKEEIRLSIRIVAATNQDLTTAIDAGRFRADLFHRLSGYSVHLPALREHSEDISALALHFIDSSRSAGKHPVKGISPEAIDLLRDRSWPGNVRELRNCVMRAVALSKGEILQVKDFSDLPSLPGGITDSKTILSLAEMEKRHITAVIDHCHGNLKAASETLQIARSTLYKKIAEYRIE